jgi:hypothetical protein
MTDEQFAKIFYLLKKVVIWTAIIGVCQCFQCASTVWKIGG